MKIGVIGLGVVGGAIYQALKLTGKDVLGYDKFKQGDCKAIEELIPCDLIFVSVPTPTTQGKQDQEPLEDVLTWLSFHDYKGLVISKCTTTPGTIEKLQKEFDLNLVHSPEFLTEKNALEDFINQKVVLIGGVESSHLIDELISSIDHYKKVIYHKSATSTELVKYVHNMYLTLKVSFCNEVYEVCDKLKIDYSEVIDSTVQMGKLTPSHTQVPGPDGKLGFGGMCFPKDSQAYVDFSHQIGVKLDTIEAAIQGNERRRKN